MPSVTGGIRPYAPRHGAERWSARRRTWMCPLLRLRAVEQVIDLNLALTARGIGVNVIAVTMLFSQLSRKQVRKQVKMLQYLVD